MHPKNPFVIDYDFDVLMRHHTRLNNFVFVNKFGKKTIKFADKQAVKALNSALLKCHYGIWWNIPDDNLCPPVPGRLDYLLYISDLISKKDVHLLDIGTGANLIYPILATCHFNWRCTASEVDVDALKNARKIIEKNSILAKTELRHQKFKQNILEHMITSDDEFDVLVCNPPFSKSSTDARQKNQRKLKNLGLEKEQGLNFGGRSTELWYKGGEVAFVKRLVLESTQFKNQVHWFTSLISKKENLRHIRRAIVKTLPAKVKVIDMALGNKKSRFIAWTFH